MAEGLLRAVGADHYESLSAGLFPNPVDMIAIDVMREIGIDISGKTVTGTPSR
jgi:arsenate reductase